MATEARPVTAMQRFARRREKIDVLAGRLFRRASGPAENPGRADPDEKNSFEARIAINERAIHRIGRREQLGHLHLSRLIHYQRRLFDGKARCCHDERYANGQWSRIDGFRALNSRGEPGRRPVRSSFDTGARPPRALAGLLLFR